MLTTTLQANPNAEPIETFLDSIAHTSKHSKEKKRSCAYSHSITHTARATHRRRGAKARSRHTLTNCYPPTDRLLISLQAHPSHISPLHSTHSFQDSDLANFAATHESQYKGLMRLSRKPEAHLVARIASARGTHPTFPTTTNASLDLTSPIISKTDHNSLLLPRRRRNEITEDIKAANLPFLRRGLEWNSHSR